MGIQDRDYYREGPSFLDRVGEQGATVWLIAITCGVFVGQIFTAAAPMAGGVLGGPLVQLGIYDPRRILDGELWRLLTPVFLHAGFMHLFFNMLILYWAGMRLEERYGATEFVLFYLFAGVGANVLYLAAQQAGVAPLTRAVGASGAVTAVLILFALHYPHTQVRLYFFIPMPVWLLAVLFVAFDTMFALSPVPDPRGNRIAYFGHIGGAAIGLLYHQTGIEFRKLFARKRRERVRPMLRVVPPPVEDVQPEPVGASVAAATRPAEAADEQLEAKLDAVLAKVSKHGQESLTPEEREILFRASELYKKRRK
jgi:membrane associated rhomboid family serine protease